MLKLLRILFKLLILVALGLGLFSGLMFWAKFWEIYSIPPSKDRPDGATLIISRTEDEPFLNAPDRPLPKKEEDDDESPNTQKGMFGGGPIKKKSVEERTIVELPYVEWLHEKALR